MRRQSLDTKRLAQIKNIILQYRKPEKIIIFGSRAGDDFKRASDIDIAIFAKDWSDKDINIIKHNLEEFIKTPLKFDVLNFYNIDKDRLKKIS